MIIKVLGPGCRNCTLLETAVKQAVSELGIVAEVQKVSDMNAIMDYNVFITPGLVINGKVKVSGRVPKLEEIKNLIKEEL
ncbi:MAG: thioredoxin family protein [Bacillota bacterium]